LSPAWFREAHTVGITAGTSTPDAVIDRVEACIRENEREWREGRVGQEGLDGRVGLEGCR
jgi:4-hydroxy-3-methylbut-2-enyl diphosphate reductase IspH